MSAVCTHQWVPMYTDRDSPQSYVDGKYRGYKVVGRRCMKCDEVQRDEIEPAPLTPLSNSSGHTAAGFSF